MLLDYNMVSGLKGYEREQIWNVNKALMGLYGLEFDGLDIEINIERFTPMIVYKGNKWIKVQA